MKYDDLRNVMARIGVDVPAPNHSGWSHISCVFAPWKHRNGVDRSGSMALKSEDTGISAYTCPACKSHGRIENLLRELGRLREQDYEPVIQLARKTEMLRMAALPPWEQRTVQQLIEPLPEPLDKTTFDPEAIFDDIAEHPDAAAFLHGRRVSMDAARRAEMRFDPDTKRIVFPVYDREGRLFGFTGRTILPPEQMTYWSHKHQRQIILPKVKDYANLPKRLLILGEHRWQPDRPVLIVEGLFAYARFLTEGVDDTFNVGALLGSEMTPGKATILKNWSLPTYLLLDPDAAGDAGLFGKTRETGRYAPDGSPILDRDVESGAVWMLAEHMPLFVPGYPPGVNDPDDLTREQILTICRGLSPMPKPAPKQAPKQPQGPRK